MLLSENNILSLLPCSYNQLFFHLCSSGNSSLLLFGSFNAPQCAFRKVRKSRDHGVSFYALKWPQMAGNNEFCFPSTSMFPEAKPRGTLRVSGNKPHCFPWGQSLSAYPTEVSLTRQSNATFSKD